jgi:hypothetical protein
VKLSGKSGLDHLVDFVIPESDQAPERVLSVINSPKRDRVDGLLFAVEDTRSSRPQEARYLAMVNDRRTPIPAEIYQAFNSYGVDVVSWSRREEVVGTLAA